MNALVPLTVAVPKGRVQRVLATLFENAGLDAEPLLADDRRLVRSNRDGTLQFLLLKPDDVPTYVEYGAAHLGICGRDVLGERRCDLYEPLDLGIGRCQLVVAGPINGPPIPEIPRVATKFRYLAQRYFAARGVQADIIAVGGSVELAPLVGLADLIVDLVETGSTLRENHLEIRDVISEISSVVIVNRAAFKLRRDTIQPVLQQLQHAVFRAGNRVTPSSSSSANNGVIGS